MKRSSHSIRRLCVMTALVLALLPGAMALVVRWTTTQSHSTSSSVPTISHFVTRSGSQLWLDGRRFRFAGANIHWLGIDNSREGTFPSEARIDAVFSDAQAMHATIVRSSTLGMSVGCAHCIEPSLARFNNAAFQTIDYSIKVAAERGIHLIIPLVDNWHFYHGGKHTFTDWRNIDDEDQFYVDPVVIKDFQDYVGHILNHVNQYTGLALKDDPTVMAWETGNELETAPARWTKTMAQFIKRIDHDHLVADGRPGPDSEQLQLPGIDLYSQNYYPLNAKDAVDLTLRTQRYGKVFFVSEFDWTGENGGDRLAQALGIWVNTPALAGDLYWQLYDQGHYNDSYTLHFRGDDSNTQRGVQLLSQHAEAMEASRQP